MDRAQQLSALEQQTERDMLIIGGGATGLGIAVDAAARGYTVALVEAHDFGKGTSSRSTKLVHGGVRYLQQGRVGLVREALRERGLLLENAPHIVHSLPCIVPTYQWWEPFFYGIGLKVYDLLSGRHSFGRSRFVKRETLLADITTLQSKGLRGGVRYYDGQFDDTRLLISLFRTASDLDAVCLNYMRVVELQKNASGRVCGAVAVDQETGQSYPLTAKIVINATGPFSDGVRELDGPLEERWIVPSQGVHIVLDEQFLPGNMAIVVPRTPDGRVVFAIPFLGKTLIGTTDTHVESADLEPVPMQSEIEFLLETVSGYLDPVPTESDIRSCFAGIRPLVKARGKNTSKLSRKHVVRQSHDGLLTIAGGKWTTYRYMAEDCVDKAIEAGGLTPHPCSTRHLKLHGYSDHPVEGPLAQYGQEAAAVLRLADEDPSLAEKIHPDLDDLRAEIVWAARWEAARTVEDVLTRRTRSLLLNARAARDSAQTAAELLSRELGHDDAWQEEQVRSFMQMSAHYLPASQLSAE